MYFLARFDGRRGVRGRLNGVGESRKEVPGLGDALDDVLSAVGEHEPRARRQVASRRADDDLTGSRSLCDSRGDVDGDASLASVDLLHLARVYSGPDREAELFEPVLNGEGTVDRPRRPIEEREDAVAGAVDHLAAEPADLLSNDSVVPGQEVGPRPVADTLDHACGADDVR